MFRENKKIVPAVQKFVFILIYDQWDYLMILCTVSLLRKDFNEDNEMRRYCTFK